jgi:hypothetical protein
MLDVIYGMDTDLLVSLRCVLNMLTSDSGLAFIDEGAVLVQLCSLGTLSVLPFTISVALINADCLFVVTRSDIRTSVRERVDHYEAGLGVQVVGM